MRSDLQFDKYREKPFDIYMCTPAGTIQSEVLPDHFGSVNVVIGSPRSYKSQSNQKRFPGEPEKWVPRGQPQYFPYECKQQQIHLSPLDLSIALNRIYKWTSEEVERFQDKNWIGQNCVKEDGVLFRKGRMKENHEIKVVGGAEQFVNAEHQL